MGVNVIEESNIEAKKKLLENRIEDTYHLYSKIKGLASSQRVNNVAVLNDSVGNFFAVLELLSNSLREKYRLPFNRIMPTVLSVSSNYALDTLELKVRRHSSNTEVKQFDKYQLPSDSYTDLKSGLMDILSRELNDRRLNVAFTVGSFFKWTNKSAILSSTKSDLNIIVEIDGSTYSLRTKRKKQKNGFKLTWDYFGGYENVVKEFKGFSETIKDYSHVIKHIPINRVIPKGILLAGPPGIGKTYLSEIFCETSGLPYIEVSASDIGSTYTMGLTLNFQDKVKELISEMESKKLKFGVFYLDELDAIAQKRGSTNSVERDTFVSVLNSNMDGPKAYQGIIFIASTNRPDIIDPALLRHGRFEKYVMGLPSKEGIEKIFEAQINMRQAEVEETCYSDSFKDDYSKFIKEYFGQKSEWTGAFVTELLNRAERDILYAHRHNEREFNATYNDLISAYNKLHEIEKKPKSWV